MIYITNAIKNWYRQLWEVTKSTSVFPTDNSLLKMLYGNDGHHEKMDRSPERLGRHPFPIRDFFTVKLG